MQTRTISSQCCGLKCMRVRCAQVNVIKRKCEEDREFLSRQSLFWLRGRTIGALRAERHTLTSAEWTSFSACHELLCSRAFLFIVLRSAQHPKIPRFLQFFRGIWPMPLSLLDHSALALFAQRTRIPTSARSIGFCAIWVCISSSSSSSSKTLSSSQSARLGLTSTSRCP